MAQRPIHEVRIGRIKAAIWRNETDSGPRFNVTFGRVYKTDDRWESTDSFGRDDLLVVAKVADLAHTWIHAEGHDQDENGNSEDRSKANGSNRKTAARA